VRTGQLVRGTFVAVLEQSGGGHRRDVPLVDGGAGQLRVGRAHHTFGPDRRRPAQCVRREPAGPDERRGQSRRGDRVLHLTVHRADQVTFVVVEHRAGGQQHHPAHTAAPGQGKHLLGGLRPGEQEQPLDAAQRPVQRVGLGQVGAEHLGAPRQPGRVRVAGDRAHPPAGGQQLRHNVATDIAGRAGDQDHRVS
jgi:hypothetical protein